MVIAAVMLSAAPGAVMAQDGASAHSADEIVVTARRRAETLTEVPASVTAYSSDFIQKQNIQSFADYATKVPNLSFQYGGGSDFASSGFSGGRVTNIRGVVGANTTAYYINDTPVPSTVSPQVLNLDRIEVLKGPQGTLFGASSMGGNLRFITKQPSLTEDSFSFQSQLGGTRTAGADYDVNGRASVVLAPDRLAVDLAVGYQHESGYITRRFPDGSGNLVSRDNQGRNDTLSAAATIRFQATERLSVTLNGIGQIAKLTGWPAAYVPLPAYRPVSYTLDRDRDVQEYTKDHWGLAGLVLNYKGEGFEVVSSTSYFARKVSEQADATEGTNLYIQQTLGADIGNPAFPIRSDMTNHRFTQEVRLSFDEGAVIPHLSGIVGVFYQHQFNAFRQPPVFVPQLATSGLYDPGYLSDMNVPSRERNVALFGELYYEIAPKLTLTAGLRQYWITQQTDAYTTTGLISSPGGDFTPMQRNSQSGLVPKAVVSYKIANGRGNVYASVSKGFRVGGAQPLLPDFCSGDLAAIGFTRENARNYKSDTLWSYEVGAKGEFANRRLSVSSAAFQIDWTNIQQSIILPTCTFGFTANAGKARIRGGELEVSGRPLANVPLTIQLGLGYTNGILQDPGIIPQAPNSRLVQVPKWTGTVSGYYEAPVTERVKFFVGADYSHTDPVKAVDGLGGFVTRQSLDMVNANIGLSFGGSRLMVFAKNILDRRLNFGDLYGAGFERQEQLPDGGYQRLPTAAVSRPRQIGVQYRVDF